MQERRTKNIFPDLILSKFFLVFCLFVLIIIGFGLANGTVKKYKVNSEIKDLQSEISRLEKQNQEFGQLVEYLNSDIFIEQEAKLKLGLKKEGENLVVIPQQSLPTEVNNQDANKKSSNPVKWWTYFFN